MTACTPFSCWKTASVHQKQPAPKVASEAPSSCAGDAGVGSPRSVGTANCPLKARTSTNSNIPRPTETSEKCFFCMGMLFLHLHTRGTRRHPDNAGREVRPRTAAQVDILWIDFEPILAVGAVKIIERDERAGAAFD